MSVADRIDALIADIPDDKLGVIFNGREPRLLGTIEWVETSAEAEPHASVMACLHNVSATFVSLARINSTGRRFVALHG